MPETQTDKDCTCRKCGLSFVPSIMFDFYPDGDDPAVGVCERCMMAEAMAPARKDPVPIPAGLEKTVCRAGQGAKTCRFLVMSDSLCCAKGSDLASAIEARRATMAAQGDNCSGPPDFTAAS